MYKLLVLLNVIVLIAGCSKDDSNPVDPPNNTSGFILCQVNSVQWSATGLEASKVQSTFHLKGTKEITGHSVFNASEIYLRIININQPGTFGIGENEPGFQYFVKGTFTFESEDGLQDQVFTAYYLDYSLMKINSITDKSIDAEFNIKLYNQDFSDSLFITNGRMNLNF